MERKEKRWRIAEYIFGGIGAALLVTILVLKILKYDIMLWTLPLVAVVIVFLIADDRARSLKRKHLAEEAKEAGDTVPEPSEPVLPKEAFEFDSQEQQKP